MAGTELNSFDGKKADGTPFRVLIVDDLLATGGTLGAAVDLVRQLGGEIVAVAVLIELDFLKGRENLKDTPIFSLIHY